MLIFKPFLCAVLEKWSESSFGFSDKELIASPTSVITFLQYISPALLLLKYQLI